MTCWLTLGFLFLLYTQTKQKTNSICVCFFTVKDWCTSALEMFFETRVIRARNGDEKMDWEIESLLSWYIYTPDCDYILADTRIKTRAAIDNLTTDVGRLDSFLFMFVLTQSTT